jgi:hypothetical protein
MKNIKPFIISSIVLFCMIVTSLIIISSQEKYQDIPVWTYWEPYPVPDVVQKCYDNWKEKGKLYNIRILHPDNITTYIPQNEYDRICKNAENLAVKSDFIALYLLYKYGGIWIDGSVFMNKPLLDWLPTDKFFTYRADRFSDEVICMESFFIYSPKGHPIAREWYNLLTKIAENEGKCSFIRQAQEEYPKISNTMHSEYLWVYIAGKYLLLKQPELKDKLNTESGEEGPWYECERNGWENLEQVCNELAKKEPCTTCAMTKISNRMREFCGIDVIN